MNIYAEPGQSLQQIGGDCPDGWVLMDGARPSPDHVASPGGIWVLPPPPVPQVVSRWQGREAMLLTLHGNPGERVSLFDAVEALMATPDTPAYYVRAWEELQDFERTSPTLIAIADELGLTSEALDKLFLFAASLRA
ncbi:MAG: hypothetical protein ACN6PJ_15915 [Achromobacter sp.]|uniref:hypothetical protein n=1 Tax=Achromobacter sp. TaxID=134375 RepID=UPI003D0762A0